MALLRLPELFFIEHHFFEADCVAIIRYDGNIASRYIAVIILQVCDLHEVGAAGLKCIGAPAIPCWVQCKDTVAYIATFMAGEKVGHEETIFSKTIKSKACCKFLSCGNEKGKKKAII